MLLVLGCCCHVNRLLLIKLQIQDSRCFPVQCISSVDVHRKSNSGQNIEKTMNINWNTVDSEWMLLCFIMPVRTCSVVIFIHLVCPWRCCHFMVEKKFMWGGGGESLAHRQDEMKKVLASTASSSRDGDLSA